MENGTIRSQSDLLIYLQSRYGSSELTKTFPQNFTLFPLRIPRFYADLIDWKNTDDPLLKMVVGEDAENFPMPYEIADPISDSEHEPVPGLIHRYPDRCLLLLTTHCAVHCRFCFRREVVGKVRPVDLAKIKKYLASQLEVKELIFSGGDPGTYPPAFLDGLRLQFGDLSHIHIWRFHTRVPAVDPSSLTNEWVDAIANSPASQKVVVTHINHVREVTPQFIDLMRRLQKKNITTLSQTVLLKGVNDTTNQLKALFSALATAGVTPYYLHHLDKAFGTHHFRLSVADGQKLFASLRGQMSGWMIPEYVVELDHGAGKFPVMWLKSVGNKRYEARSLNQKTIYYDDPLAID